MKRIFSIILTVLLLTTGCTDYLILEPQDELIREEFWQEKNDVVLVLGTSYAKMSDFLVEIYLWAELRGGLFSPNEVKVKQESLDFFNYNLNENNENIKWDEFYLVINFANTVIEYASTAQANDKTFTDELYDGYIAEAYFIRSLCYFYLVKSFKDVPLILKSYDKDDQNFLVKQSTEQEIIDQLISDLVNVVDGAFDDEDFIDKPNKKGRATKNAIYALLADIYLWNNDYRECIDACDAIEERIVLVDRENYFDIFALNGNSDESIFELQFDYNVYETTNELYEYSSNDNEGKKEYIVSEFLTQLYSTSDLRQLNSRGEEVTINVDLLSIWKYQGNAPHDNTTSKYITNPRTKTRSDANWIFYRKTEIHLMKAEAFAELKEYDNSLVELNKIKKMANISEYTNNTNQKELLVEILNERAREFVGEGKRWFDLVRICRRDLNRRLSIISDAAISNVEAKSRSAVAVKLKDVNSWFLPKHFDELNVNTELDQNPFYE